MLKLEVVYRLRDDIRADVGSARHHPRKQIAQIAKSIEAFGFTNPILIDEDGRVIAGNGRLRAATLLDMKSVPTITLSGLDEQQRRLLALADNRLAEGSSWNTDLLRAQLEALTSVEIKYDLDLSGFSSAEIDNAVRKRRGPVEEEPEISPPDVPTARAGDIWQFGPHRLGCGDCRDLKFVTEVMDGVAADAAFLDPPYNVPIGGFAVSDGRHSEFKMASGEMTRGEFVKFLREALCVSAKVSRDGAVHFCTMDWRHMTELMEAGDEVYDQLLNLCVWNKSNAGMGSLYRSKHELVFVFKVGEAPHYNGVQLGKNGRNRTNVWDYSSVNSFNKARQCELNHHPTVKPQQLVADAILDVTKRQQVVLDCFSGSGTTLLACEQTDRVFRGIELDPAYVDVAIHRWNAMSGGWAFLETTGQSIEHVRRDRMAKRA